MKKNSLYFFNSRYNSSWTHEAFEKAREFGDIIIGLMTSKAVAEFKRIPILTFEQRKKF